jgi:hypothetical protein
MTDTDHNCRARVRCLRRSCRFLVWRNRRGPIRACLPLERARTLYAAPPRHRPLRMVIVPVLGPIWVLIHVLRSGVDYENRFGPECTTTFAAF